MHRGWIAWGVLPAALAPIAVIFLGWLQAPLGFIGATGLIVSFWLERLDSSLCRAGATVQEEFDTQLFGLRWNELLVGDHPRIEDVHHATAQFRGSRESFKHWYPDVSGLPPIYAQLVVQRCTAVWDQKQRQTYSIIVAASTVLLVGVGFAVGLFNGL